MKPPKRPAASSHILVRLLSLALPALILFGCELLAGKGGGTETESNVVAGRAVNEDGSSAILARVTVRPADYLQDLVSTDAVSKRIRDTVTDASGHFSLDSLPAGEYRIEIAGSEARGAIRDFALALDGEGLALDADTLKARGSVRGSFAPDSEAQLTRFVQVFGMERMVIADRAGEFILYNLPEGVYDIRCSSLQPFRRDAVLRGIEVRSGETIEIPTVKLEREAKLGFTVDSVGLKIEGLDSDNPVVLDNERWDNGVENEYIWAKASLGTLDLRGNIVTNDFNAGVRTLTPQLAAGSEELRLARLAGLEGIPDLVAGAAERLRLPASGRLEDIEPLPSAGSDLIVAEARKATPEKPLLVVAGGPLTTVAQAYLTDPSIAPRMVVAGIFSYSIQAKDSIANYLVAKKCRFVQWGRTYSWDGKADTTRLREIPPSRMGENLQGYLSANTGKLPFGDLAPVAYLFNRGLWKTAQMVKVSSVLEVQAASNISFDFLDIPASANDWLAYNPEFFATLSDPAAYHPKPVPGSLEAEGYIGRSGISGIPYDSAAGSAGITIPAGAYAEYRIEAGSAGRYGVAIRYRCGAGGRLSIGLADQPALSETDLPATIPWREMPVDSVSLPAGTSILRLTSAAGKIDLLGFDLR